MYYFEKSKSTPYHSSNSPLSSKSTPHHSPNSLKSVSEPSKTLTLSDTEEISQADSLTDVICKYLNDLVVVDDKELISMFETQRAKPKLYSLGYFLFINVINFKNFFPIKIIDT